jgi:hypothetical protein
VEKIVALLTKKVSDAGVRTLMFRFKVPPGHEPYLVSSTKSCLWVPDTFDQGEVKAAVRQAPLGDIYRDLVTAIAERGREQDWGNVHPATRRGVLDAILHLADFDFFEVTVLCGTGFDTSLVPGGVTFEPAGWLPETWAVVVPVDKSLIGLAYEQRGGNFAVAMHNTSRGVCVLS